MAARPFVVDDARVVDRGACQVESWFKRNPGSHELWALPSCNVAGFELTAGGGQSMSGEPGVRDERDYQLQAKTLFRELAPNDWGWGVAAGVVRHANINVHQNLIGSYYAYLPVSKSFLDDRIVLLTNVGAVVNRDERRNGLSWGVGGEFYLTPRFMLLTEIYSATGFDRFSQSGARCWLVPDRLQIDATYGWQWNCGDRTEWITVGPRLISPTFF